MLNTQKTTRAVGVKCNAPLTRASLLLKVNEQASRNGAMRLMCETCKRLQKRLGVCEASVGGINSVVECKLLHQQAQTLHYGAQKSYTMAPRSTPWQYMKQPCAVSLCTIASKTAGTTCDSTVQYHHDHELGCNCSTM